MYKIGIIGDLDSILGLQSFGVAVHPADSPAEAVRILHELAEEGYAVIYIVEDLAVQMTAEIAGYAYRPLPAVVPVPGISGNLGFGMGNMKTWVEKAIGADILFNEGRGAKT
ncbi:MAG TPA: V-type ATP synthase subunit F [Clostridiales bacterium]|nr:V-type ATP synthase subunit F [Clostridiales bacterium]